MDNVLDLSLKIAEGLMLDAAEIELNKIGGYPVRPELMGMGDAKLYVLSERLGRSGKN